MTDLITEAALLQEHLRSKGWDFCFIGGLAIQRWGEPRMTRDMDVTILANFGDEQPLVDELLAHYAPRITDAREFALANRVLLLRTPEGTGIDIALGALPFECEAVARARDETFAPGILLRVCTAEDLIVMKAFAGRPIDWIDVRGIVVRQGVLNLDWARILEHLRPLCEVKDAPENVSRLERIRAEAASD
jgi:hypothetical protein